MRWQHSVLTVSSLLLVAMGILCVSSAQAVAAPISLAGVPDFSQSQQVGWRNFCAPTCGTDVAYYFSQIGPYQALRQGNPMGPGNQPAADNGASSIIAGLAPIPVPNPKPGTMAAMMGTTTNAGTTANGLVNGLDTYLETHDGIAGNARWTTVLLRSAQPVGGPAFWNTLQNAVAGGSGVVLCVGWKQAGPGGSPGPEYELPENYYYDEDPGAGMGHALTMVGYDAGVIPNTLWVHDPANNAGVHAWPAVNPDKYNVTVNPGDISIGIGAATATVYAAVITTPVPEPGTIALVISGALALGGVAWARRRGEIS